MQPPIYLQNIHLSEENTLVALTNAINLPVAELNGKLTLLEDEVRHSGTQQHLANAEDMRQCKDADSYMKQNYIDLLTSPEMLFSSSPLNSTSLSFNEQLVRRNLQCRGQTNLNPVTESASWICIGQSVL
jgi:hypothetical protein